MFGGGLLRSDYIVAGVLWSFLAAMSLGLVYFVGGSSREIRKNLRDGEYGWAAASTAIALLVTVASPVFVLGILTGGRLTPEDLGFYYALVAFIGTGFILLQAGGGFRESLRTERGSGLLDRWYPYQTLFSLFNLLLTVMLYSSVVYPEVRAALGGGQRDRVVLIMAAHVPRPVIRALPRSRRREGVVGPVAVLLQTDHDYYVLRRPWLSEERAIVLPRDLVIAILPE